MDFMQQGLMGQVEIVNHHGIQCVSKKSLRVDYSIELEIDVLTKLQTLNSRHFPILVDYTSEPRLYIQYVDSLPLSLVESEMSVDQINSMKGMSLAIASIMNNEGIVHHDLHCNNVLLKDTDVDVNRYTFPDGQVLEFRTYGMEPVLIDYGQSFDKTSRIGFVFAHCGIVPDSDPLVESRRLVPSLFNAEYFDEYGFFKDGTFESVFDEYSDPDTNVQELLELISCKIDLSLTTNLVNDSLFNECIQTLVSANLPLAFIKVCLDSDIQAVYKVYYETHTFLEVAKYWNTCRTAVKLFNEILTRYLQKTSKLKRKIYKSCKFKSNKQVSLHLMKPIVFDRPYSVRSYDVDSKTTSICIVH
jgi:hypothetical protein